MTPEQGSLRLVQDGGEETGIRWPTADALHTHALEAELQERDRARVAYFQYVELTEPELRQNTEKMTAELALLAGVAILASFVLCAAWGLGRCATAVACLAVGAALGYVGHGSQLRLVSLSQRSRVIRQVLDGYLLRARGR